MFHWMCCFGAFYGKHVLLKSALLIIHFPLRVVCLCGFEYGD